MEFYLYFAPELHQRCALSYDILKLANIYKVLIIRLFLQNDIVVTTTL